MAKTAMRPPLSLLLPALMCVGMMAGARPQSAGERIVVRAQDSASFLAMRQYGFYSDSLLALLQRANPHVRDWQHLHAGETLILPDLPSSSPRYEILHSDAALAILTFCEGVVQFRRGASRQYQSATVNLLLRPGDEIITSANSRAEMVLDQRSVLRLDASSRLRLVRLARVPEQERYQGLFELIVGSAWARITKIMNQAPQVDLQLPTAIAGVQGTSYRARVAADSATTLRVYEGAVAVRNKPAAGPQQIGPPQQVPGPQQITLDAWIKLVRAQQEINIAKNGRPGEPRPFADSGAETVWVRWNQVRDRDLHAGF